MIENNYARVLWVAVILAFGLFMHMTTKDHKNGRPVTVKMPALSLEAQIGKIAFEGNCMRCHGQNGGGTDQGPPLIHKIYEPSHHSDGSFYRAAKNGVVAHHWQFGNMPPVPSVSEKDVSGIIRYIREIQRANGIF